VVCPCASYPSDLQTRFAVFWSILLLAKEKFTISLLLLALPHPCMYFPGTLVVATSAVPLGLLGFLPSTMAILQGLGSVRFPWLEFL
jgi:hypothetical protein